MIVTGLSGSAYSLSSNALGQGGEGKIYSIIDSPDKVVKIYEKPTRELESKLIRMTKYPPAQTVLSQVAWPLDVVYDSHGYFCGFVMPKLDVTDELTSVYVYPPSTNITLEQKLVIAQNICVVIEEVHKAGYIFGDFNPKNIGVNLNNGHIAFFDTDSYHIVLDRNTDKAFRCIVCAPGYAAPELLEKCKLHLEAHPEDKMQAYAKTPLDTFTQETDNFALAIHVFKLLMNGYTPFNGIPESSSASAASPGNGDIAVSRDNYCFKAGNKPMSAAVPPLTSLPTDIQNLFTRAFIEGRIDPSRRPTAVEWHKALSTYQASLVSCKVDKQHMYYNKLKKCPWCEADANFKAAINKPLTPTYIPVVKPSNQQQSFSTPVSPVTQTTTSGQTYGGGTGGSTYVSNNSSPAMQQVPSWKRWWKKWWVKVLVILFVLQFITSMAVNLFGSLGSTTSQTGSVNSSSAKNSSSNAITDTSVITASKNEIRADIERAFSSLSFSKGAIYTETDEYDTSLMSAEISNLHLSHNAYLYQTYDGEYTQLYVPIYFTLHIKPTAVWDEDTIDNMVGYCQITNLKKNSNGELDYSIFSYFSAVYFTTEELMVQKWLNGNGYIVEKISF